MIDRITSIAPRIFISHSVHDAELAAQLIDLLRYAFSLSAKDIRCTTVDGARLPGGAQTDEHIRREVVDAVVLISLISESAMNSAYVMFELGARWGVAKPLIPLLAPGSDSSVLSGPLAGINALRASSTAELYQLVQDVATVLDIVPDPAPSLQRQVERIVSFASTVGDNRPQVVVVDDDLTTSSGLFTQIEGRFGAHYLVRLISDPQAARALLNGSSRTRLCITDVVFRKDSELAGVSVAEAAVLNKIPTVVMTGHNVKSLGVAMEELRRVGIPPSDVVSKPVTRSQYAAFMRHIDKILLR